MSDPINPDEITWDSDKKPKINPDEITWDSIANAVHRHLGEATGKAQQEQMAMAQWSGGPQAVDAMHEGLGNVGLVNGAAATAVMSAPGIAAQTAARAYGAYEGQKTVGGAAKPLGPEAEMGGRIIGGIGGAFFPEIAGKTLRAVMKSAGMAKAVLPAVEAAAEAAPTTVKVAGQAVKVAKTAKDANSAWEAAKEARRLMVGGIPHVWDASAKAWVPQVAEKAAEVAPAVAEAAPKVATNVVKAITDPETLIARIKELREVQKFSGAQIAEALKQWHGIPMKEATQAVKMVLGGS